MYFVPILSFLKLYFYMILMSFIKFNFLIDCFWYIEVQSCQELTQKLHLCDCTSHQNQGSKTENYLLPPTKPDLSLGPYLMDIIFISLTNWNSGIHLLLLLSLFLHQIVHQILLVLLQNISQIFPFFSVFNTNTLVWFLKIYYLA